MAKEIKAKIKLQAAAGKATPAPPIGPALGAKNVNIGQFVSQFNERSKDMTPGMPLPVEITVYADNSFTFIIKSPPAAALLKEAAGIASGSGTPNKTKVGKVTKEQVRKISEMKFKDLNARDLDAADRIIFGTARSMGVEIE